MLNLRKKLWGGVAFFAVILGIVPLLGMTWNITPLSPAGANLDIAVPDVLIRSKSLSKLPADMLRVPLLHDLLTEDFLYYYENSEARLGLSGTLRRIAYEHDVTLSDELIRLVMDEPANVALWRGSNGALKYFAIAMTRNRLAKLLEPVAKIALMDKQLTLAGELRVSGDDVQLFALEYAWNRKLLFASHADRIVVFSDPGMLLTHDGEINAGADALLNDLLGADKNKQQRFARAFAISDDRSDHSIVVNADFLSFSYRHFFPALKALRFDFSEKPLASGLNWSTSVLINVDPSRTTHFDAGRLWSSLPFQPSACVSMPVDWHAVSTAMNSQKVINVPAEQLAAKFEGPAAVCWYANSRLHAPLFVAQLNKAEGADAVLQAYFNYSIKGAKSQDDKSAKSQEGNRGNQVKPIIGNAGDVLWQNSRGAAGTQATLARSGRLIYFSPDTVLVERALAVAHKRQPALSDGWTSSRAPANTVAVIGPEQLALLAGREVAASLPQQQDAVLRTAADQHLLPKLDAMKKYPQIRLEMRDNPRGAGWVALDWQQH
jgi:uncharacterized protein YfaA (DUF2138 family)